MIKKIHQTDDAPAPVGPYSQAVEVDGFLYCSGQIALDAKTGEVLKGTVEEQTQKCMENTRAVLAAAGMDFSHVIKTTIFITNMDDFARINSVYGEYFDQHPPARSCVEVSALPKGVNVEIEVLAKRN